MKTGMMLASFHSSGREPLSRDQLNRVDSDGAIWWAVSFSSLGEIPSGPVASYKYDRRAAV